MVQAADLRASPVFRHQPSRNAYNQLLANPLIFLQNHRVTGNAPNGWQSAVNPATPFELLPNGNVNFGFGGGAATRVPCIVTPMRENDPAAMATRTNAMLRFAPGQGGARTWITDQQTGCTVLMLDWGGGQTSMVHVRPHQVNSFGYVLWATIKSSNHAAAIIQRNYLRNDVASATNNSKILGANPVRYALVESQFALNAYQRLQVVGVVQNGSWQFYLQTAQVTPTTINIASAQQIPWRTWNNDWVWKNT